MRAHLESEGFEAVRTREMTLGVVTLYLAERGTTRERWLTSA